MTAEDDAIRAECEEWASARATPLTSSNSRALRDRIRANPDAWWRNLQILIAEASDNDQIGGLAMWPLRITLACGGTRFLDEAASIARTSSKMASALMVGANWNREIGLYKLFGRDHMVDTWIRHDLSNDQFDFWAWALIDDVVRNDAGEAWPLILSLLEKAPNTDVVGAIAASPLEDFIIAYAPIYIGRIEEEALKNARFKEALAGVWIMRLRRDHPDLFDRVEMAAGVPLRRV